MVEYKIVKKCRICEKRFVVPRTQAKDNYCDECKTHVKNED